MTEDSARNFYLVRAVELEDRENSLLTAEDRSQAELKARPYLHKGDPRSEASYLEHRAAFAAVRLSTRFPLAGRMLTMSRWPRWINWALPLAAFVVGALSNELGNGRHLDLLAVPLLGALVWNLIVYLWLLLHPLNKRRRTSRSPQLVQIVTWLAGLGQRRRDRATVLSRALGRFARDWGEASAPLAAARASRTLHMGAAFFALGLVASIYVRALAIEYRAGWESTFLGAAEVQAILSLLLGPASFLTGIALPSTEGIAALRWTNGGGANAGPWIHLYVVTVLAIIVVPRLLLTAWQSLRIYRMATRFPIPGRGEFYTRRLLRAADGTPLSVRVTAYGYKPASENCERLEALLREALGDRTQVRFDEPIHYGAEDEWLAGVSLRPDDDYHILLFTLSSTPEAENHGRIASALGQKLTDTHTGTALAAVLDESGFRRQFASQADLNERLKRRRQAWETVMVAANLAPLVLDLAAADDEAAQRLEAVLMQHPALEG